MTSTEFKKKLATATEKEWFSTVEVTVNLTTQNFTQKFKGIGNLYDFINQEFKGWETIKEKIPNELTGSKNYFKQIKIQLESLLNNHVNSDRIHVQNFWTNYVINFIDTDTRNIFTYNSLETLFLIDIFNKEPNYFVGAYNFITDNLRNVYSNKNEFTGATLANDFFKKEAAFKFSRKETEQKSFLNLKKEFQETINEASSIVVEHLKNTNDKYEKYVNSIEQQKNEKDLAFQDWFTKSKNTFEDFDKSSTQKIKELQKTYQELLKLKEPANYWKQRATTLKGEGWLALKWLIVLILFGCITLYFLLWQTPEGMLKSFFSNDKATAIKWSIVFITFISFLAFGIKALSKVMFSSFHLSRDAEEREHLTYVYLSLIKDSAIEKDDRNLIMQSLFSRADSGLLKEDSTPAMPSMVEKVMQR